TGLLYIVGRRPFLAWLLALDSPSIHFSRAFDYRAPHDIPRGAHPERLNQRPPVLCRLIVVVQYVAAIGSVVNVWLQAWELGIQTFCTVAPNFFLAPALWTVLRVFLHLLSMILVRLRIRRNCGGVEAGEFRLCVTQKGVSVDKFKEGMLFVGVAWFLHILYVAHTLFCTLVFSSFVFIGTRDAVGVLSRLMASAICCRVIIMYEISGLREA
ncbi:hypothetical protein B0T26DRAFT_613527, partial [Lasiosphaeria miniovina]